MRQLMKWVLPVAVFTVLVWSAPPGEAAYARTTAAGADGRTSVTQPALVILVRHAEKAAEPANDPPLTPAGVQRARDLAAALKEAGVDAVVTTQFERTRATAAPLVAQLGITPQVVRASGSTASHAQEVAAAVRALPAGQTVLVVGHSNTIPSIIAALGGPRLPDLCDPQYATLFVLSLDALPPSLVRASYGVPDAPESDGCSRQMR